MYRCAVRCLGSVVCRRSEGGIARDGNYSAVVGDALGHDVDYVGRLRTGRYDPATVDLWIVSDNVRKGSALDAVLLAQLLIKNHL